MANFALGSIYATAELRTDDFEAGVNRINNSLQQAEKKVDRSFTGVTKNLGNIGGKMSLALSAPIIGFGALSFKTAAEVETAWKGVAKVYGDTAGDFERDNAMLEASVDRLSDKFAKSRVETLDVLAGLTAMGYEGSEAVQMLDTTMGFAVTGGFASMESAMEAVISTSKIYGATGDDLTAILANLNLVENTTAASMQDLGQAITAAGSTALNAGVDVNELSAYMAIMRERGVEAGEAANGLKTILTRVRTPEAVKFLDEMGIKTTDMNGKMMEADEVLAQVSKRWPELTDVQREDAAQTFAGVYQKSRFLNIMDDLNSENSVYTKTMDALNNSTGAGAAYQNEMNVALESTEMRMARFNNKLDSVREKFGLAFIDAVMPVLDILSKLADWFANLNPNIQQAIVIFGLIIAVVGPLLVIFSTLVTTVTGLAAAFGIAIGPLLIIIGVIVAVIAAVALLIAHWDEVVAFLNTTWQTIVTSAQAYFNSFVAFWTGVWNSITTFLTQTWANIQATLTNAWNSIVNFFTVTIPQIVNTVIDGFISLVVRIPQMLQSILNGIGWFLGFALGLVVYGIPAIVNFVIEWFAQLPGRLQAIWNNITATIQSVWNNVRAWLSQTVNNIVNAVVNFFNQLPGRINAIINGVRNTITAGFNAVRSFLFSTVPAMINSVINWIAQLPSRAGSAVSSLGGTIRGAFSSAWNAVIGEVSSWPGRLYQWGSNIVSAFADGIRNAVGQIADAFASGLNAAKGMIMGQSPPKEGPWKNIDKWGLNVGEAWVEGVQKAISGFSPSGLGEMAVTAPAPRAITKQVTEQYHIDVKPGMFVGGAIETRRLAETVIDAIDQVRKVKGQ